MNSIKMTSIKKSFLVIAALLTIGSSAYAQKAGEHVFAIGVARISPDASVGTLTSVGPAAGAFNASTSGATANVDSVNTGSLSVLHMFTDNIAAEFTLGIPPELTVDVNLTTSSHPGAATTKVIEPAVIAKYLFNMPADKVRPYVGLGVTHISFTDITVNTADPTVATLGGTSASLSSSWAPVYNAGLLYNINERLSLNASISYVPLKTDFTFVGSGLGTGTTTTGTLELNPTNYVVRLGYKF